MFSFSHRLHACVRYNPPAELVKILLALEPEAPACVDVANRTPLHVAVGMHANISIIETLVHVYPDACATLDWEDKTPLHLACNGCCDLFEEEEGDNAMSNDNMASTIRKNKPCLDTIRTLLNARPLAAVMEDQDGMTPLEHAIISDASLKVVEFLQFTTRVQCEQLHWRVKRNDECPQFPRETNTTLRAESVEKAINLCRGFVVDHTRLPIK